jgi:hypothetical protein
MFIVLATFCVMRNKKVKFNDILIFLQGFFKFLFVQQKPKRNSAQVKIIKYFQTNKQTNKQYLL